MKLIFAQGNPGERYTHTRHNVGFLALQTLADKHSATWKESSKYNARIAEYAVEGEKVLLVQPQSFYNETGLVARQLIDFYKLNPADDVLVVHDDLALPVGTIRIREKGSDAGNNGIKSLNAHIGEQYTRLRIGIWSEQRDLMDDASFVLSRFTQDEQTVVNDTIIPKTLELVDLFVRDRLEKTSHRII